MSASAAFGGSKIADVSTDGTGPVKVTSLEPEDASRIEDAVDAVLASVPARVWDGRSLPVPVNEIAREVYGLRVCVVSHEQMKEVLAGEDEGGTISGLLLTGSGEIWINREEFDDPRWGAQRGRFTTGHELGHFVIHRQRGPMIFCRSSEAGESLETAPTPRIRPEVEANTFSAALLMPSALIRKELSVVGRDEEDSLEVLKQRFNCSRKAIVRRVKALQSIS